MSSLDPRINRLGLMENQSAYANASSEGDPFEMFWLPKIGKPYEHVGIVHAADKDLALIYAKEQYSRRGGNCYGLMSATSEALWASPVTDAGDNAFDALEGAPIGDWLGQKVLVFGLKKRGKQHILLGSIEESSEASFKENLQALRIEPCMSIWVVPASETSVLEAGSESIWNTLSEKLYREAIAYKSADKIKAFVQSRNEA